MHLTRSPWQDNLEAVVKSAKQELLIATPYFGIEAVESVLKWSGKAVKKRFLLALSEQGVGVGIQSPAAVVKLLKNPSCTVKLATNLHAKFIVADRCSAIVTSSNLTMNGLRRNAELGVFVDAPDIVREIAEEFDRWFKSAEAPSPHILRHLIPRACTKPQAGGRSFGGRIVISRAAGKRVARSDRKEKLGWILVHGKKVFPNESFKTPQDELDHFDWNPEIWNWTHGKYGLKRDGRTYTLLMAWNGEVFAEGRATVGKPDDPKYNVGFHMDSCIRYNPVSMDALGCPEIHHGLIRLTSPMLKKYRRLTGRSWPF